MALRCDVRRVRKILTVLIAHAVLRSAQGGLVTLAIDIDDAGQVRFRVEDQGTRPSDEEMRDLLVPFFQANNEVARSQGGAGLGLPLSKAVMESHGGTLRVLTPDRSGLIMEMVFPPQRTVEATDLSEEMDSRPIVFAKVDGESDYGAAVSPGEVQAIAEGAGSQSAGPPGFSESSGCRFSRNCSAQASQE